MENITYNIKENNIINNNNITIKENKIKNDIILLENTSDSDYINQFENEQYARSIDYEINYSIKYLTILLELYGIKKTKMNKFTIIKTLVDFEMNSNNILIVNNSKRLYENLIELKNNSYLSKFILI